MIIEDSPSIFALFINTSLFVESIFLIESDSHSTVQSGSVRITSQVVQSTAYKYPTDID